jgi:dTDP-4-amino-4,6-dideoxygalactose transaminase
VTERAAKGCLSLPIFPEISDSQIDHVASSIASFKGW